MEMMETSLLTAFVAHSVTAFAVPAETDTQISIIAAPMFVMCIM